MKFVFLSPQKACDRQDLHRQDLHRQASLLEKIWTTMAVALACSEANASSQETGLQGLLVVGEEEMRQLTAYP